MAAIEARFLWHRTANHCPVQEDATLASSPSSTEKHDSSGADTTSVPAVIPCNNSFETKWCLQLHPNIECLKDINFSHLSSIEHETDEKSLETISPASKFDGKPLAFDSIDDVLKMEESFLESPRMVSTDLMKNNSKTLVKEISMTTNYPQQPLKRKADMNFAYKEEELLVLKPDEQLPSRRIDKTSELGSPWDVINKSEPWWRSTDKDDLYLLVAQKSLLHIENCDLPKPTQIIGINKQADDNGVFQSSLDRNPTTGMCDANELDLILLVVCTILLTLGSFISFGLMHASSKILWSYAVTTEAVQKINNLKAIRQLRSLTLKRTQLLEALRHAQTRARKAEMSAQKAYREKEHAVKLLLDKDLIYLHTGNGY
ncbi:hypothetical protein ZIOFF_037408 [Zingiber officinale]|uniref:Uncharacterized protein n=1 Tax=Zingiber officinale TaxID=94328 RepID=A0A8J5L9K2_ZINOF|nr:hypothetical protein ZIOFF_037408 [Zingiber officinale]